MGVQGAHSHVPIVPFANVLLPMIITGDRLVTVRRTKNLKSFIPYTSRPFFLFAESLCLAFNNLAFKAAFSKHLLNLFNKHSNHTGGDFFSFLLVVGFLMKI